MPLLWMEEASQEAQNGAFPRAALTKQDRRLAWFGGQIHFEMKAIKMGVKYGFKHMGSVA